MIRPARGTARAARTADAAANRLDAWLRQPHAVFATARDASAAGNRSPVAAVAMVHEDAAAAKLPMIDGNAAEPAAQASAGPANRGEGRGVGAGVGAALRLPHTDWLHHRLVVTGPADALVEFRAAASGAGTIPWQLDGHRLVEDFFHRLAAPPSPQRRRLSLTGARELARQLREAVEMRHAAACARVGHSRACAFDLHALVPVPPDILRLGPDEPDALAWLWEHWGTTAPLRHVAVEPAPTPRTPEPAGAATATISFWSADWTPWRALAAVRARWTALHFDVRPTYGRV